MEPARATPPLEMRLGMTPTAESKKKQIPHFSRNDNRGVAIMMRGHGCSACHPEPGRLVLANGEGSALDNLSFGIGGKLRTFIRHLR